MKLRAAAYIRVSTEDQTEYSPDAQLKAIEAYADRNNMAITPEHIYRDEGISGKTAKKRPSFMQMIATAKKYKNEQKKPFDVILVHKFDRFSRNREESIVYKSMLRKECGIKVISITEHIEDDKFSVILEAMLEAMAEYYSLNLADEVKKGMTEKAHRGEFMSVAPFGYKWENGRLVINNEEARYVEYIFDSYLSGKTKRQITQVLNSSGLRTHRGNPFELRTVDYILKNIIYKGYTRWSPSERQNYRGFEDKDAIIRKGTHDPIIPEEVFDKVQVILKTFAQGKNKRTRESHKHWLSGIIKCSNCGASLSYVKSTNSMQCYKYSHSVCTVSHSVLVSRAAEAIMNSLSVIVTADDLSYFHITKNTASSSKTEIAILQDNIKKCSSRLTRLKEAYLNGIIDLSEYKTSRMEEEAKTAALTKELDKLAYEESTESTSSDFKKNLQSVYDIISSDKFTDTEKNLALKSILHKAVYNKNTETFEFYYQY